MGRALNAKNPKLVVYDVVGSGTFPMDMLRYDRAFPASEQDANTAMHGRGVRTVCLRGLDEPTKGRWESFSWTVGAVVLP